MARHQALRDLVKRAAVGSLRRQQAHFPHAQGLQVERHFTRHMQQLNARKTDLQRSMSGVRRVAGDGDGAGAQLVQPVESTGHGLQGSIGAFADGAQGLRAVGHRQLRQPMPGKA